MTRNWVSRFALHRHGTGVLQFDEDDHQVPVQWELSQTMAGTLFVSVRPSGLHVDLDLSIRLAFSPNPKLVGFDSKGNAVVINTNGETNPIHAEYNEQEWITLRAKDAEFIPPEGASTSYRFALLNLCTGDPPQANWEIDGVRVSLTPAEDYDAVTATLHIRDRYALTAFLNVKTADREVASTYASTACELLSFAVGCRVTWIYLEGLDESGNAISAWMSNAISGPYLRLNLITEARLWDFISEQWRSYTEFRVAQPKQARRLLGLLLNSVADDDFLEVRGAKLASTVEAITTLVGTDTKLSWIGSNATQRTLFRILRERIAEVLTERIPQDSPEFPGRRQRLIDNLGSKVKDLVRPTFREQLEQVFAQLHLTTEPDVTECFVKSRNELIHEARFVCQGNDPPPDWPFSTPADEYFAMVRFADRLVLRAIGYRGPFLDRSARGKREIAADPF